MLEGRCGAVAGGGSQLAAAKSESAPTNLTAASLRQTAYEVYPPEH